MKTLLERTPLSIDTAILLIRVVLAGLLGYHGYDKLMAYERMVEIFPDTIGVGGPLTAHLAIFAEFFCSIFIAVGFLTRFTVLPIMATMAAAAFIAHAGDPFEDRELALAFLGMSMVIFSLGSGKWSIDRLIFKH